MLTKTEKGYGFGPYEGIPTKLPSGRKITVTETRAALCRVNGLTQKEAAAEMSCSKGNVAQMWQSIYFKTNTNDALGAIMRLIDLGVIKHLVIALFIATSAVNDITAASDAARPLRARQSRMRAQRAGGRSRTDLLSITGLELYSDFDLRAVA